MVEVGCLSSPQRLGEAQAVLGRGELQQPSGVQRTSLIAELHLFTWADPSALCSWRNTKRSRRKSHLVVVSRYEMWLGKRQGVKAGGELGVDCVVWFFPKFWTLLVCLEGWHWF